MTSKSQEKVFDFIDANISESGYALINIKSKSDGDPVFTYTLGLSQKGLPELVFVRRPIHVVQHVVTDLIAMNAGGWSYLQSGQKVQGVFEHDICLIEAQSAVQTDIMKIGGDYSESRNAQIDISNACIVCWPDGNGRFPDDIAYEKSIESNVIPFKAPVHH